MADYLIRSALNGRRPRGFEDIDVRSRNNCFNLLLTEREKVRVISAPAGYGKKCLAVNYANTMFECKRTFWFDCKSPCFLRDLDSGQLFQFLRSMGEINLVIFADVPRLSEKRVREFLSVLGYLHKRCAEAILISDRRSLKDLPLDDYKLVGANDLIVSQTEMKEMGYDFEKSDAVSEKSIRHQIAGCFWSREKSYLGYEKDNTRCEFESLSLIKFLMYVAQRGSTDFLYRLLPNHDIESLISQLRNEEPHIFISSNGDEFCVETKSLEDVLQIYGEVVQTNLNFFNEENLEDVLLKIGEILLERGMFERAFELVGGHISAKNALFWATKNISTIFDQNVISAFLPFIDALHLRGRVEKKNHLIIKIACLFFCGCYEHVTDLTSVILRATKASVKEQVLCLCFDALSKSGEERDEAVSKIVELTFSYTSEIEGQFDEQETKVLELVKEVSDFICIENDNPYKALVYLGSKVDGLSRGSEISDFECHLLWMLIFVFYFDLSRETIKTGDCKGVLEVIARDEKDLEAARELIVNINAFVFDNFSRKLKTSNLSFLEFACCKAAIDINNSFEIGYQLEVPSLLLNRVASFTTKHDDDSYRAKNYMIKTSEIYPRDIYVESITSRGRTLKTKVKKITPYVYVRMFGQFRISAGSKELPLIFGRRKKSILILCVLLNYAGQELGRDELLNAVWNEGSSNNPNHIRNFYTLISSMNKSFREICGFNYIKKSAFGYSIDPMCISSDLVDFKSIYDTIIFGTFSACQWHSVYESIKSNFRGSLLPSIKNNDFLDGLRVSISDKRTECLVAASQMLYNTKEFRGSCVFADEALRGDENREDAYLLLMQSQRQLNQRSAAIDTFFRCKETLGSSLGIDPSIKLKKCYEEVLNM